MKEPLQNEQDATNTGNKKQDQLNAALHQLCSFVDMLHALHLDAEARQDYSLFRWRRRAIWFASAKSVKKSGHISKTQQTTQKTLPQGNLLPRLRRLNSILAARNQKGRRHVYQIVGK